ncbi:putative F-box protein At4g17780 [Chenopodium quinoa]|uniref:putative F-box protein At4g17780 n=1 Tax=Chenopodium quinoa TaxID=63459 RepID=UPI000B78B4DF|nr:putative F-box protein At4g17780 [Chenopodium quinoa]
MTNTRSKSRMKKTIDNPFDKLPSELFTNIFSKLPVQNILKARCVCKEWNSIITHQDFTLLRLQLQPRNHFLSRQVEQGALPIHRTDSLTQDDQLITPLIFQDTVVTRVASYVHGVLLMYTTIPKHETDNSDIILWNPSIRKMLAIPCFIPGGWDYRVKFGFGFDFVSSTYKVVSLCPVRFSERTKVFNLQNRSWLNPKQRIAPRPMIHFTVFSMAMNFDNNIYWLGSINSSNTTKLTHFLCFDLDKEAFTSMKCPDIEVVAEERYLKRCSAVLDNSLAVLDYYDTPNGRHGIVWKGVKSGSSSGFYWTKQFKLDVTNNVPQGFSRHKVEIWFRNSPKGSISNNDLENHEDELRALSGVNWLRIKFLDRYVESLVLLLEGNDI